MARETKVGLLAGLAFIVCFAVILANRGQDERFGTGLIDRSWLLNDPAYGEVSSRTGDAGLNRSPSGYFPRDPSRLDHPLAVRTDLAVDRGVYPAGSGAELALQGAPDARQATGHRYLMPASPSAASTAELPQALGYAQSNPNSVLPTSEPGTPLTAERPGTSIHSFVGQGTDDHGRGDHSIAPTNERPVPPPFVDPIPVNPRRVGTHAKPKAVHKVAMGETLSSIVASHYGSRSQRYVDAVVGANRAVLSNPNVLPSGVELIIPELADTGAAPVTTPNVAGKARSQEATPQPKAVRVPERAHPDPKERKPSPVGVTRWYNVKRNDRFVSIAREQLGDASRWREVYEMNRDRFPNPERIREGVRIKLPPTEAVATGGTRR